MTLKPDYHPCGCLWTSYVMTAEAIGRTPGTGPWCPSCGANLSLATAALALVVQRHRSATLLDETFRLRAAVRAFVAEVTRSSRMDRVAGWLNAHPRLGAALYAATATIVCLSILLTGRYDG